MALGRRAEVQGELFVMTTELPRSPGHPFYQRLNELLAEAKFDEKVEALCEPHYASGSGRPSIPPGVYFRMLFIGYFEGIDSQRGIAWRCADSRSLSSFLGLGLREATPDHSSLTRIRQRLPLELHEVVFRQALQIAQDRGLLRGKTLGIDSTTLEANAAMKSIVRKDSGEDYKAYIRRLAEAEGLEDPSDDDLRRFDRKRKGKKTSNEEWESSSDPESRIARMKDGTTHMAYKAEHAVDLETDMVVAARVYAANRTDHETVRESLGEARKNLALSGCGQRIEEVVADSGYHKAENLAWAQNCGLRTYIPQPRSPHDRRWRDRPAEEKEAVYANRRRTQGARGRRLRRRRGEMVERTFAHVCDSGGMRRTWLRGVVEVGKRYLVQVAARNLGVILRNLFGVGTPRRLQGACGTILASLFALIAAAATCSANLARRVISASSPLERFRCLHFSA